MGNLLSHQPIITLLITALSCIIVFVASPKLFVGLLKFLLTLLMSIVLIWIGGYIMHCIFFS